MTIRAGQTYLLERTLAANCQVHYAAPYSGAHEVQLEPGTTIVVSEDYAADDESVVAYPTEYDSLHATLVSDEARLDPFYVGYGLELAAAALEKASCIAVPKSSAFVTRNDIDPDAILHRGLQYYVSRELEWQFDLLRCPSCKTIMLFEGAEGRIHRDAEHFTPDTPDWNVQLFGDRVFSCPECDSCFPGCDPGLAPTNPTTFEPRNGWARWRWLGYRALPEFRVPLTAARGSRWHWLIKAENQAGR